MREYFFVIIFVHTFVLLIEELHLEVHSYVFAFTTQRINSPVPDQSVLKPSGCSSVDSWQQAMTYQEVFGMVLFKELKHIKLPVHKDPLSVIFPYGVPSNFLVQSMPQY